MASLKKKGKYDPIQEVWESMSVHLRKELQRIKITQLKAHYFDSYSSQEDGSELLNEAVSYFGNENNNKDQWRFWVCCYGCCDEKIFSDADLFMQHIRQKYSVKLSPEHRLILPQNVRSEWVEMILNCSWKPLDLNAAITRMLEVEEQQLIDDNSNWPSSNDDPERTNLLESIRDIFHAAIKNKLLASSHLKHIMNFAVTKLKALSPGSQLYSKVDQTPLCICFLGTPHLEYLLDVLLRIFSNLDHESAWGADDSATPGVDDTVKKIIINQDSSFLVIDVPSKDSDALFSWITTGASTGEQLASWKRVREEKAKQGREILELLKKECYRFPDLCEQKDNHSRFKEGLNTLENICLEEARKRENIPDFVPRSYYSVLKKRGEELIECSNLNTTIEFVLKDAESIIRGQVGQDDDEMTKEDSCIKDVIKRQKGLVSLQIDKDDARIMKTKAGILQLEVKLQCASSHDLRSILIPLVKSFLQARLQSDVASKALSVEFAPDSKKGVSSGVDNQKKRTNDKKKKSKKNRKNRDPKTTNSDELHDQTTANEETLLQSASDDADDADDAIRLEEEEQKLAENLEYQRRIENEAKQKCLAEQHRNISETTMEKAEIVEESDSSFSVGEIVCKFPVVGVRNADVIEE